MGCYTLRSPDVGEGVRPERPAWIVRASGQGRLDSTASNRLTLLDLTKVASESSSGVP